MKTLVEKLALARTELKFSREQEDEVWHRYYSACNRYADGCVTIDEADIHYCREIAEEATKIRIAYWQEVENLKAQLLELDEVNKAAKSLQNKRLEKFGHYTNMEAYLTPILHSSTNEDEQELAHAYRIAAGNLAAQIVANL